MRVDSEIKQDVENQLRWNPDIDSTDIAVNAKNGVVTLAGFVRSYQQKWQAERDAKRVSGVLGIANDIEVRLPAVHQTPDPELVRQAVKELSNFITLKPRVEPIEVKRKIEEAFKRSAEIDANHIQIEAMGSEVVLRGNVRSWAERQEAERVAWQAPGVRKVNNRITIE